MLVFYFLQITKTLNLLVFLSQGCCISYLFLCNTWPQNFQLKTTNIYYLSFRVSGIWEQLRWVVLHQSHNFVVRMWLGLQSSENLSGGARRFTSKLYNVLKEASVYHCLFVGDLFLATWTSLWGHSQNGSWLPSERKRENKTKASLFITTSLKSHTISFTVFYLLEMNYLVHPLLKEKGIKERKRSKEFVEICLKPQQPHILFVFVCCHPALQYEK